MEAEYTTQAPGLFHAMITEPVKVWTWCPVCWDRTEQTFKREDDLKEYYTCAECRCEHGIAVR